MMRKILFCLTAGFALMFSNDVSAEWHVAQAPIRIVASKTANPSHPSAGLIMVIPDGGALPGSKVDLISPTGAKVKCGVLWHSKLNGLVVVVDSSMPNGSFVYISPGKPNVWTPASGLTPSYIIATDPTVNNMSSAQSLGKFGVVKPQVHFTRMQSGEKASFALMPDLTGRPRPASMYALTYLDLQESGKTLFNVMKGQAEVNVLINGMPIGNEQIYPAWGGRGSMINCQKGLSRCDVFGAARPLTAKDNQDMGVMYLNLKYPSVKYADIAGTWSKDPETKIPPGCKRGAPKQAVRPVKKHEIVKSGRAGVIGVQHRNKLPVASFTLKDIENIWGLDDGPPAIIYLLNAVTNGLPADTEYTWTFADGSTTTGAKVVRFLAGNAENQIKLTASTSKGRSVSSRTVYGYTTVQSSMDEERTRDNIRAAFLSTIRSYPLKKDPTELWTPNLWAAFHQVQELGKGPALLSEVLTKRWDFFRKKMSIEKQEDLKKKFFQFVSHYAPEKAEVWLKQGALKSPDFEERRRMKLYLAELYMYHLVDFEKAKKILKEVVQGTRNSDSTIRASIRLGDVAFLERDVNTANKFWGAVQNGVDISEVMIVGDKPKKSGLTGLAKPKSLAEKKAEAAAKAKAAAEAKKKRGKKKGKEEKEFVSAIKDSKGVENWKQAAVVETTVATEVISLMSQGFWDEAYEALHRWERGFPLSKISGDYLIQEAEYYLKTGNRKRARALMEAFCDNIDASAFVADAAEQLLNIKMQDKDSKEEIKEFCEKMKKRFEFHPLADRMTDLLKYYDADKVKREVIKLEF